VKEFVDDDELAEDIVDRQEEDDTSLQSSDEEGLPFEVPTSSVLRGIVAEVMSWSSDNTDSADDAWCECPTSDDDVHDADVTAIFSDLSEVFLDDFLHDVDELDEDILED
jgi:hypothetical protein